MACGRIGRGSTGPYPMEGCCSCKAGIGNFGIAAIGPCVNDDFANDGPDGIGGGITPLESLPAARGSFPVAAGIAPSSAGITPS